MTDHYISDILQDYARHAKGAIVQVGAWLGHGTKLMAEAAPDNTVYVYDRFHATASESHKAMMQGVQLYEGEDTFLKVSKAMPKNVVLHKTDISSIRWADMPIGLYVDDAAKRTLNWEHVVRTFFDHIVIGGMLVLCDYYYPAAEVQRSYMPTDGRFEPVETRQTVQTFRRVK